MQPERLSVVLYNPRSSANRKPILPFALLAVGAVLEGRRPYVIVDGNLEDDPLARLRTEIGRAGRACILGVTVMPGPQLSEAVNLCRSLRSQFPDLIIVWGGYFPTQHWDVCLESDLVDFVVRGHGEFSFLELVDRLAVDFGKHQSWAGLPGLAFRSESEGVVAGAPAPLPLVDELPPFSFDCLPVERYVRRTFLGQRTLGYHSSYGCPFFCNFCAVVNMVQGRWSPQSAEQVAAAVQNYVKRWKVDAVEFYDNNFFVSEERTAEFAERVSSLGVSWWGESRIDTLLRYSERTWQTLKASGLKMVFMGAESGSLDTLRRMKKGGSMTPDKTLEIADRMKTFGIVPEFSFVVGSPPDPARDVEETISFVRKVKRVNPAAEIILYLYTPVPLSGDLYDQARENGFEFPKTLEDWTNPHWSQFSQRRSGRLPWLSQSLSGKLRDFERVLNAYYPTVTDSRLTEGPRLLLRATAAWRYHSRIYRFPLELRFLQRAMAYQRPETSGF